MPSPSMAEIRELSISERIQLVEDIWDSIAATPDEPALTDAQRTELDRRLEAYYRNPNDVVSWEDVKNKIRGLQCPTPSV
jgi:putative addiction module component (TIGR02574 family)